MREVGQQLLNKLKARASKGPPEAALDEYIPLLEPIVQALDGHAQGSTAANAARRLLLVQLDEADDSVDTLLRLIENFLYVQAHRRTGPNIAMAAALYAAAVPDGLKPVDDYIPDENRYCRKALDVLRHPDNAATVAAIKLPMDWLDDWSQWLGASDSLFAQVGDARKKRSSHVDGAQDAEADFVEVCVRLRKYIGSRAGRRDKAMRAEGEELLAPLVDALRKADIEAKARAMRKTAEKKTPTPNEGPKDETPK
jgi:hypothetical protein